jgi:hypothetical protein
VVGMGAAHRLLLGPATCPYSCPPAQATWRCNRRFSSLCAWRFWSAAMSRSRSARELSTHFWPISTSSAISSARTMSLINQDGLSTVPTRRRRTLCSSPCGAARCTGSGVGSNQDRPRIAGRCGPEDCFGCASPCTPRLSHGCRPMLARFKMTAIPITRANGPADHPAPHGPAPHRLSCLRTAPSSVQSLARAADTPSGDVIAAK